ncbi:MAG: YkgJ family cysteine cluster protein [Methanoregula sp.]|nr:YkgJ family cysteine cluster protein [Methanoregula sp.]
MVEDLILKAEAVCHACGGICCNGACPPLSEERIRIILSYGDFHERIEKVGYHRIKGGKDGLCSMLSEGKCAIHAFKPETCIAGPFTFDLTDHSLRIFLKQEKICPLVAVLKANRAMYDLQFGRAVESIAHLVARLLDDELAIISALPEPDTDQVAELPLPEKAL